MRDYKELLVLVQDLAKARIQEIAQPLQGQHICGSPACDSAKTTLKKYLTFYQEAWEYAVTYGFRTEPEGIRTLLIKETMLHAETVVEQRENEAKLLVCFRPTFAPLLQCVFPDVGRPDVKVLYGVSTTTTWQPPILNLYWISTVKHDRDWAVVAPNMMEAVMFYGREVQAQGIEVMTEELGQVSYLVSETIHRHKTSWATQEAIWSAGGQITKFQFPRAFQFGERVFQEGPVPPYPNLEPSVQLDKTHLN